MEIKISDEFDIKKIAESGQCFRIKEIKENKYRAITKREVVYIEQIDSDIWSFECSKESFDKTWFNYFDLKRNYANIRNTIPDDDQYLKQAGEFGKGIRILNQNLFEVLISFIISQRKNIAAIKKAIENLTLRYGEPIITPYEKIYTFPEAKDLEVVTEEELRSCGLGYRAPYIIDAIRQINSGNILLEDKVFFNNDEIIRMLKEIKGVGDKVANCILLFGYGRIDSAPVDVWIARIIEKEYHGVNPFDNYSNNGGIMQQYMFYYAQKHKKN